MFHWFREFPRVNQPPLPDQSVLDPIVAATQANAEYGREPGPG